MTKIELQKEILEKVKPGTKPSDLKKLKRSKSDGDISSTSPLPTSIPLSKSSSQPAFSDENKVSAQQKYPYTTLISQSQEIEQLKEESKNKSTTISLLRKKITELEKETNDTLLTTLAETMEELNKLKETPNAELDTALFARHKNLKDWFKQFQQTQKLDKELVDNVNEASEELTKQDETISALRTELRKLKQTNQSLEKDLELAQRLAHSRKTPFLPIPNTNWIYLELTLYSLFTVLFVYWMIK